MIFSLLFLFGLIFTFSLFTEAKLVLLYELFFSIKVANIVATKCVHFESVLFDQ